MSDLIGLGSPDADGRWIGVRRHQIVLVIIGLGLAGDGVVRSHGSLIEMVVGGVLIVGAAPATDGLSVAETAVVALTYWGRSRWTTVRLQSDGDAVALHARGRVSVRGYELRHRGRLDLSGQDVVVARTLASFADGLASGETARHVSLHVQSSSDGARTLLTLPGATAPPEKWTSNNTLLTDVLMVDVDESRRMLERWTYVRSAGGLSRVLRVSDFTSVPHGQALLGPLQGVAARYDLGLHFDVIGRSRAHRIVERAVHRLRSDGAVATAAGFRRTARASRSLERLGQREALVAGGRSLLRVAVFVTVRASSYDELGRAVAEVLRVAQDSGLRCERGAGRQARWYCHQLPGGPGW